MVRLAGDGVSRAASSHLLTKGQCRTVIDNIRHLSTSREPGESLRVGLIGLGDIVRQHIDAINAVPGLTVAAVCDRDPIRLRRWQAALGCDGFVDPRSLLQAGLDMVVLLLPHHLHAPVAIEALDAGLHVVVEKPMATTPSECRGMLDAAECARRLLLVADTSEFLPGALETSRRYCEGSLGRFLTGSTLSVREYFVADRPDWFLDPARSGGGMFANVGVHRLAMTRTAVPGLEPIDVTAAVQRPGDQPVEACTTALVRYLDGSSTMHQEIGHVPRPAWLNRGTHLLFEHGIVAWDADCWHFTSTTGTSVSEPLPPQPGYQRIYERAVHCIESGSLIGHAEGAARDVAIVAAAYHSADTGKCVSLQDFCPSAGAVHG